MEHRNFLCKKICWHAHARCCPQLYCCELSCTASPLRIVGQPVPLADAPTTSSNLSFRYTRPVAVIQEEINVNYLTISDTTPQCAPLHLRQLFHHYNVDMLSTAHVMFLLVYLIALESGFVSKQHFLKYCRVLAPTPKSFTYHSKNVLFLSREKPLYQFDGPHPTYFSIELRMLNRNFKDSALYAMLTVLVSSDHLIITLTPAASNLKGYLKGYSSCLPISRYVLSKLSAHENVAHYFRKLDQLTIHLRNEVLTPVRNRQLEYLKANIYPSFEGLPTEIREIFYEYLSDNDLKNISQASKKLNAEVQNQLYDGPQEFT